MPSPRVVTCAHCGALLEAPESPPFVCNYCGAHYEPPPRAEGQIHLTEDAVSSLLRQYVAGVDSTFLHPAIPQKKLDNVKRGHHPHLDPGEVVLGIYDGTAFGSAKDGWAITTQRLCFKNQMQPSGFLRWSEIEPDDVYPDGNDLRIGSRKLDTLFGQGDDGLYAWSDAIATLARSARPAEMVEGPTLGGGVDAGWGGPEVAIAAPGFGSGGRTIAGGLVVDAPRPDVERFAQKPYAGWESASVVDAHPSGELVLAASGSTIELRYAQSGARYRTLMAPDGVLDARFSPDGERLLAGDMSGRATIWNVRQGTALGTSERMGDYCDQVAWLGSDRFVMASQTGEVHVVETETLHTQHRLLGPDPDYHHLGGIAVSGSRVFVSVGERLGAFDADGGQIVWRLDGALRNASRLTASPDGATLLAAGHDGVAIFDARTGQPGARCAFPCAYNVSWPEMVEDEDMFGRTKHVYEEGVFSWSPRPAFSPQGDLVAMQDAVGNLVFLDLTTTTLYPTAREQGRAWIEDLAWFADGNHVLLGSSGNELAVWRVRPLEGVMRCRAVGG